MSYTSAASRLVNKDAGPARSVYLVMELRRFPSAPHRGEHPRVLQIRQVSLLVRDYDPAIAFYVNVLGFELVEDTDLGDGKRWVRVRASERGAELVLARAATDAQRARVGDQSGGRVWLFVETDDFARDHARLLAHGVRFLEAPRRERYGTVAVFEDLYGNKLDLIEPAT